MTKFPKHCNLCDSTKFHTLESDGNFTKVLKCTNCSLIFVHPVPSSQKMKEHYNENYYAEWIKDQKNSRIIMWNKRFNKLINLYSKGKILDVGCGDGLFLNIAKNNGWHITGTETSPFASKFVSKNLKTNIFNGELYEASFSVNSFDVVTLWHVLEHVVDPKNYLTEIHRILKPNGKLILAVPNANNLIMRCAYRIIKRRNLKMLSLNDKEIHLYYFSKKTLKKYFDTTGFKYLKFSPDFGITEFSKKLINWISVIPYYTLGINIYNSIEVVAVAKKEN